MNIEIKKLSFKDYFISRCEIEKTKLSISLIAIWIYFIFETNRKNSGLSLSALLKEYALPSLIISLGINIFVYLLVYFFSYKKALRENGVIKAQITENYLKNFVFFGNKGKQTMRKFTEFNKFYERKNGFYFNLVGRITFFMPKNGMTDEEKEYISGVIKKNRNLIKEKQNKLKKKK